MAPSERWVDLTPMEIASPRGADQPVHKNKVGCKEGGMSWSAQGGKGEDSSGGEVQGGLGQVLC